MKQLTVGTSCDDDPPHPDGISPSVIDATEVGWAAVNPQNHAKGVAKYAQICKRTTLMVVLWTCHACMLQFGSVSRFSRATPFLSTFMVGCLLCYTRKARSFSVISWRKAVKVTGLALF